MSRLVAVSNRTADARQHVATGGLAVGVLGALQDIGGMWFGWNGQLTDGESHDAQVQVRRGVTYATIDLNSRQFEQYYNGFCNNTLWPLFHYRVGFFEYDRSQREAYLSVNALFARKLVPLLEPDDLLWIHDFHLIPLGAQLRQMGVTRPLGFFLHIPFPSFEVLRALPAYEELLAELCAYDLVGFQTERDLRAFRDSISRPEVGGSVLVDGSIRFRKRKLRAQAFPIGVDVITCAELAAANDGSRQLEQIRASLQERRLIIGVDRLDYSKGLPKRFQAYERLLHAHPESRRRVVFMQIAPRTRIGVKAYTEIRHQLEQAAGHINGTFAEADWVPLRYLNRGFDRGTLMAMFRLAKVGLVTPLRDGMNLVAKEYVAAQDPVDPGVLVLSAMAGAAEELRDAMLVNPHDIDAVAEGILRSLTMSLDERRARHATMLRVLTGNDATVWRRRFVDALTQATNESAG